MRYPNLGEMMTIQAKRWKNKPLVYFEDKVYTYMQVEKIATAPVLKIVTRDII